ncbi:extracellular solute-binding protein [Tessaracoccus coleopterorum]|uniref:extracellular solute-binding protein n=1 Tax=Tessaracoccus coleopterorum TaxID=2714950 RepID=UPI0022B239FC|nr:extracellular solute-binding protein [Tessaracoccus coleopterorum]
MALTACGGTTTPRRQAHPQAAPTRRPRPPPRRPRPLRSASGWSAPTPPPCARVPDEDLRRAEPGSKIVIEEQQWTGLVDKLTTSLSSNDSPDIVEMGNTQAAAFTSVGALADLTGIRDAIGGDDLLPASSRQAPTTASSTPPRTTRAPASCSTTPRSTRPQA